MQKPPHVNAPIDHVPYLKSVIPPGRLQILREVCMETLRRCPGNVLEVGVYKGGSLVALAEIVRNICPEFVVFGLDTFHGHPYSDGHPVHPEGKYGDVSMQHLESCLQGLSLMRWVRLYTGRVENVLRELPIRDLSFAHIDCDLYMPVRYCAVEVPKLIRSGGVIYFDDYRHEHCPGATKAVDEIISSERIHEVYLPDDNTIWSGYVKIE